ncbi:MAG: stage II sporulation protein M [Clostridia bacterium]|nr:stage II sporulation protein M [Clostridia bacterium]
MKKDKRIKLLETIKEHVLNNKKEYMIVTLLFIIGIFLGVLFVNHVQEAQKAEITAYFNSFIEKIKSTDNLNYMELLKTSIGQNVILAIVLWFFGTTVIGLPVVFGLVLYRGFCLGYTIAVCVTIMGLQQGIIFVLILLLLQNMIFIPAILALAVSGFKLYQSIIKDRNKENIKIEVVRHTIFSFIMLLLLMVSSAVEIFLSTNILKGLIKYF